jgi:ABC-2 type transport system ATP-binding protein
VQILGTTPRLARARVGFQTEIFFTYPHLTCAEAVTFYGKLSGLEGEALKTAVDGAVERVGLRGSAHRKCGGFSKGMVQRIGLAQSLVHDPDLVIWDEPSTGLDPEGRALVFDLLAEMRARGKTVILSTHILEDIEKVCTHLAVISGGRLLAADAIDALLVEQPSQTLEQFYLSRVRGAQDER